MFKLIACLLTILFAFNCRANTILEEPLESLFQDDNRADETGAADSSRRRYCGGITYNPSFKICCGGTVQLKFGTRPRCCGTKAYDTSIQMCCGRTSVQYKLYRMSPRCCGTRAYDTSYQMCCDGISVQFRFGSTPRCCGTKGYDARSRKCCKNWLGNKWVCGMGDADQPLISK
ncbi:unnamed protein product [Porites lobata]|uniref:Galaxin-like repeats domain-containing protein n=1 Tax=Porites lobata TaxID=104759 RepID=A0ABN8Q608_9CNID|nr:unnamed protein product [Porites lobata]